MAKVLVNPPQNLTDSVLPPQPQPLTARLIQVTGDDAEIAIKNNLKTPVTILKLFYTSTIDAQTVKGVIENPGTVKPGEEMRLTVRVPQAFPPFKLTINLAIHAETAGVYFTEDIVLCN